MPKKITWLYVYLSYHHLHTVDRIAADIAGDRFTHENIQHCEYNNLKCHDT